ncbi:DUF1552 domain-containing protein [Corallococcus praedator]|uniref:DUF1552 domain-containing protein n=1 Tax=Corallococcus praedator TaxID=2316724 RepID=A0ABX9QHU2_9BACT|nr:MULTISPECIES: DUF1552 domain-containing protein [Corallococcus]RKH10927.1 DUF1552 domain-containing protein [Corallococcus sp. CA047B]RKH30129.1 DUF1552 domain-containing protein [Corallococcus sp. CA031C]RKI06585.1 DUF1552 domain-containing protein [Corallococcus praedator]
MPRDLSRRSILKLLSGTAMAAPFAHLLTSSVAEAADAAPLRFIALFTPHGVLPEYWTPKGGETDFNIDFENSVLQPLQRHRSKLLVLDGLDYRVLYEHGRTGHEGGPVTFLTGSEVVVDSGDELPAGPSLDQVIGNAVGGSTQFRSLQLHAFEQFGAQHVYNSISFTENGSRVPFELNPANVYKRLFGSMGGSSAEAQAILLKRKSLMDYLIKDATRLKKRLATAEGQKLDTHLEALRDIERRLTNVGALGCVKPEEPSDALSDLGNLDNMPGLTQLHMDLIARAFACDLTRVVTMTIPGPSMPWIDIPEDIHNDIAHRTDTQSQPERTEIRLRMVRVQQWYSEQLALLMDSLAAIPEGSGTVLDNTVILWGNELGDAAGHMNVSIPTVLAGGAGGKFRMGRYLALRPNNRDPLGNWEGPGKPLAGAVEHNKLLTSIAQAFGVNVDRFGHEAYTGTLPGLT